MKKILTFFIFATFLHSFSYGVAFADISATITLMPTNPIPKSSVTLTLESYSFDVDTAFITWQIAGKVVLKGLGEKSLTVKTGTVGQSTRVNVTASMADGSSIEQYIDITPSSVVLLYEAPRSYVPTFYEGRSLPSDGGLVKVTAFPQISDGGRPVPPSSLAYSWYLNDSIMKTFSGIGRQSALIRLDYLKDKNDIKVIVRSPLGNTGTKTVSVYAHPIMPLLYSYDPVFGSNFTTLIERRLETASDMTVSLEPFYVSQKENKEPTYSWFLDGLPVTPLDGKILALHPKENSYGTKMLSIKVLGPDRRLQQAETKTEIIFDTRK